MQSEKEQHKTKNILIFKLLFCVFSFALLVFFANTANAATLYFSPSSGDYSVGNIINATVLVNTQGIAMNNSDAIINFPSALLEVISLSKSGSIFTLWVEEPAFSNSAGTISFNGGLPTPGYNGSAGRLLNLTFRVRNAGLASLIFSSAAVRANDGYGTDILQTKGQAQFNLVSEERPVTPPPALGTPQAPRISSPTHPDSNKWYAKGTATFTWSVPSGVDAARLLVGKIPTAQPVVLYLPAIDQKTIGDLENGVWYFHAQLRNDAGWGETTHFRFQTDTVNPERFDIKNVSEDPTDPKVKFVFDAFDKTSGIDYYEVKIDDLETEIWKSASGEFYQAPALSSGQHTMKVKAFDRAGNSLTSSIDFEISSLEKPVIINYPKEVQLGEPVLIEGLSQPDYKITVRFQRGTDDVKFKTVESDASGGFSLIYDEKLAGGDYNVWAEAADDKGAKSAPSEKVAIKVRSSLLSKIGASTIMILVVLIIITALVGLLIFTYIYMRHQIIKFKAYLRKDVHKIETDVHKAFDLLKEDIREQIKLLERARTMRKLTEEEEKIINRLKKHFDEAEKFIEKEIEDIEKEIK